MIIINQSVSFTKKYGPLLVALASISLMMFGLCHNWTAQLLFGFILSQFFAAWITHHAEPKL